MLFSLKYHTIHDEKILLILKPYQLEKFTRYVLKKYYAHLMDFSKKKKVIDHQSITSDKVIYYKTKKVLSINNRLHTIPLFNRLLIDYFSE